MTDRSTLTAVILTKNEAPHLERCLASLRWAAEIIVLDSGSTDGTQARARELGARVVEHAQEGPFRIDEQRNWALNEAGISTAWVIFIDADESVPASLAAELERVCADPACPFDGLELTPRYLFWGKWLKRTQGYPNWHQRAVRLGRARFTGGVWEHLRRGRGWAASPNPTTTMRIPRACRTGLGAMTATRPGTPPESPITWRRATPAAWGRRENWTCAFGRRGSGRCAPGPGFFRLRPAAGISRRRAGLRLLPSLFLLRVDDGHQDCRVAAAEKGSAAVSGPPGPVWFCTSVGGGVFGAGQTSAWRAMGLDARLHYEVEVADYWRAKAGPLARLRLRWAMYASYPLSLRRAVRNAGPGEIFVAVTNPFFLPALAARAADGRGAKVVQLVYDLYPDALVFGGGWSWGHPAARLAARTTRAAIDGCAATVYLGQRLRQYAEARYGVAPRTAVIAVGTDTSVFEGSAPESRAGQAVRCLYSGHMGKLHDWRTLGDALAAGIPAGLAIEIASDGPGAEVLKRLLASLADREPERLAVAGTRGDAEWREAMLAADVAIVTMRKGAEKVVMPSKTYSAMAAGQAILAVCPRESDLADLVAAHDCGWVIEPGNVAGLRRLLAELPETPDELLQKRRNSWRAAHAHYSMEVLGRQWGELLGSLDAN